MDRQPIVVRNYRQIRPDGKMIRRVLALGIPSGIENSMFQLGKLALQSSVSTMGTVAIAAQAMTNILENLNGCLLYTSRDMYEAVTSVSNEQDIIVKAAAVADYRPSRISEEKVKKSDGQMSIELERTDDILKFLGEHKRAGQFLCGFSMETQNVIDNSRAKLAKKNLDMVAANNVKVEGAGFQGDTNVLTLITQDEEISLPLMSKEDAAFRILDKILSMMMQDFVC